MSNLNLVETTVTIAGTPCHFICLSLEQLYNTHHTFRIEVDFEELDEKWMDDPTKMIKMIGLDVNITMKHRETGEQNLFSGIITNVSLTGYHGQQNSIVITGSSPTIRLAGKPAMDSFMDLPLQQIVEEAVANSGNGCPVTVNPVFKSKLDYVCMYNENCFDFLNRLSWEYGEWFFYNGLDCYFGKNQGDTVVLEYDKEMSHFDLSANLIPSKFNRYHYLNHDHKEIDQNDPASIPGVRGYLEVSKQRSESIYTSDANNPLFPSINAKKDLDDLVKAEKSRAVGEMLVMRGETHTCKVKIGGKVSVKLPSTMDVSVKSVDTFLVTKVRHVVDQAGHYSNRFEAIMDGIEVIPMEQPHIPMAGAQIATVKDNADSKGRVKVEMQWQKKVGKTTNWIRVLTPDAGKSDKVSSNRGLVTIPEIGDLVMLGFEYGNPDRPYVAGSVFAENVSKGGGTGNKSKSLTTRSGATVTLDDDDNQGSITIKDPSGNKIILDGNENIKITAPTSLKIDVGGNTIEVKKEGTTHITTSKEFKVTVGGNTFTMTTDSTTLETPASVAIQSASNSITGQNHITGGDTKIDGGDVFIN